MANYQYSSDLINDALHRASELSDGTSDLDSKALNYLNRAYQSLCLGGTEFVPELHRDWWWLRTEASLVLQPMVTSDTESNTVTVTQNNASITFSDASTTTDLAGYYFKVEGGVSDIFKISTHGGSNASATLDTVYTGDDKSASNYKCYKLEYDLASDVSRMISPMQAYQSGIYFIEGLPMRKMEMDHPLALIESGVPTKFAMVDEDTVRFNKGGDLDGDYIRVDYDYIKRPTALTDSGSEEPAVPLQYRQVLADMTCYQLLMDKEEIDKAAIIALQVKSTIKAMAYEHDRKFVGMGDMGKIKTRQRDVNTRIVRSDTQGIIFP